MSRSYPLAVNAATALSDVVSGLDRNTRQTLVDAVKRDQARLARIAQRTQQAQALSSFLCVLCLYRAWQTIEVTDQLRQTLVPQLDEAALSIFDELVHAYLAALLERQAVTNHAVVAWCYQKGVIE
jgi:hypothetical protein